MGAGPPPVYGTLPGLADEGAQAPRKERRWWLAALVTLTVAAAVTVAAGHFQRAKDCVMSEGSPLPGVGHPIIVLGMLKAGTSSVAQYFKCGGLVTSHYKCRLQYCGECIRNNMDLGRPPFTSCGDYTVWAQIDYASSPMHRHDPEACYFPQVEALDAIHAEFPNATFILNTRNVNDWIKSVDHWSNLRERLGKCDISGLPAGKGAPGPQGDAELTSFWWEHISRVRTFVQMHPSHKLVEVAIDTPGAGVHMQQEFGISAKCWGNHNNNLKSELGKAEAEPQVSKLCAGETPKVMVFQ